MGQYIRFLVQQRYHWSHARFDAECTRIQQQLARFEESTAAYNENIQRAEQLGDDRQVAVGKGQLGTVWLLQHRYPEPLAAYAEARKRFIRLNDPINVAGNWDQTGMVYQDAGQPAAAEDAYRNALMTWVQLGHAAGEAMTLNHRPRDDGGTPRTGCSGGGATGFGFHARPVAAWGPLLRGMVA